MRKRCSLGKSCGATCIDPREGCVLEFGPEVSTSLTKVREFLRNRDISWTDEQAAKWARANLKNIDSYMLDHLEGGKGSLWLVGNEPGAGVASTKLYHPVIYEALRAKNKNLSDAEFSQQWSKLVEDSAPLQARILRGNMEDSKLVSKFLGRRTNYEVSNLSDPKVLDKLLKGEVATGWNVSEEKKRFGSVPGIDSSTYLGKGIKMAAEVGANKMYNTNVSWLPSPNEKVWPWGKMFERSNIDPGPFKSRSSWIKHSVEVRGDLIKDKILKEKPENVYISGSNGTSIFEKLARGSNPFQTTVKWVSANGNERQVNFMVVKLGESRIVLGPHFTAQMPRSVIDMRAKLMKGERPDNAVTVNTGPTMRQSAVRVAKAAEKELKREVKPEVAKKVDMATWSVTRLQTALQRAYDREDTKLMAQIQTVLNSR